MGNYRPNVRRSGPVKRGFDRGFKAGFGGGRGFANPGSHRATCAACGDACEVPFRPNGSKPVYCRACFKKQGGLDGQREQRARFTPVAKSAPAADGRVMEQLATINAKLDAIMATLSGAEVVGEDESDEE